MSGGLRSLLPRCLALLAVLVPLFLPCSAATDEGPVAYYTCILTGAQGDPPSGSLARGRVEISVRGGRMRVRMEWEGLSGPVTGAHLHGTAIVGDDAPVVFDLVPGRLAPGSPSPIEAEFEIDHALAGQLDAGRFRADLHSAAWPGGEIRGQVIRGAADQPFSATD
jgi:hypothetical protein